MKASRKKKRRKVQVPIASMGDIAFLLIIFFMLLSEFSKEKDLAIDLPRSDQVNKTEVVVVARVEMTADGAIYFDGDRVDNAKDIEWGVRALLSKTVADEQRHVQFKCDAALSKEKFEPVLKAIAEGGGIIEAVGENQ